MPNITVYVGDDVLTSVKTDIEQLLKNGDYEIVRDQQEAMFIFSTRSHQPQPPVRTQINRVGSFGQAAFGDGNMYITNQEIRRATNEAQQQINKSPLSEEEKQELAELFSMLETALQRESRQGDAEKAKQAVEKIEAISKDINQSEPKWYEAKLKVEDLIEAAKNLGVVVPYALPIVEQILGFITKYAK